MGSVRVDVIQVATDLGLDFVSCVSYHDVQELLSQQRSRLVDWQESGYAGQMAYMMRSADIFTDLKHFLPLGKSVVSFAVPYQVVDIDGRFTSCEPTGGIPWGSGIVARYAWGRDYHRVVKRKLESFVAAVGSALGRGDINYRVFVDAVPLLERAIGFAGGQGFVGKNTLLIKPGMGSFFFLAEVLWDVEIGSFSGGLSGVSRNGVSRLPICSDIDRVQRDRCGDCVACLQSCPSDAFVAERILDCRRCIAYLTIEKRGVFSDWEERVIGNRIFGCDVCQEVCPYNSGVMRGAESRARSRGRVPVEFGSASGVGPHLSLKEILMVRDARMFVDKFGGTALQRATREGLLRNACAVAANTLYFPCWPLLSEVVAEDESGVVRSQAKNALVRLKAEASGLDKLRIAQCLEKIGECQ